MRPLQRYTHTLRVTSHAQVFPLGAAVDDGEVNKLDGVRLRPSPPFASGAASQQEVAAATVKALRDGRWDL
jgi:hypothetical protein